MPADRLVRILAALSSDQGGNRGAARMCEVAAEVTGLSGAGIMLMMTGDVPQASVCTSDAVCTLIEELQYTLGEGPGVDAHHQRQPILEPDLATVAASRWPAFTPPAVAAGARAVFGFPLAIGAVRLGALDLYRDRPGPLTSEQHTDALLLAGAVARAIVDMQADAPPGAVGAELEAGSNFRRVVHQATGMVAVQLGVHVTDALIRLRAYAFSHDRLVTDVASDIVSRRLRLDDRDDERRP